MKTAGTTKKSTEAVKSAASNSLTKGKLSDTATKPSTVKDSGSRPTEDVGQSEMQKKVSKSPTPVSSEQISARAYQLWLERGCVHGFHLEDWLEAEAQVLKEVIS